MSVSDKPLIVCFKNYMRNRMVNLSTKSIKHFLPNVEIYCYTLYKENLIEEYKDQEPLLPFIKQLSSKTKYTSNNDIHDHIDASKTSGFANDNNSVFFTEGYNLIYNYFKDSKDKILILGEDHFFLTGQTLKEIVNNDFDVAYGDWDSQINFLRGNGSILCMLPDKVKQYFPLPEVLGASIEWTLGGNLLNLIPKDRLYKLSTRDALNYHGDGFYTNSSFQIEEALKQAGII